MVNFKKLSENIGQIVIYLSILFLLIGGLFLILRVVFAPIICLIVSPFISFFAIRYKFSFFGKNDFNAVSLITFFLSIVCAWGIIENTGKEESFIKHLFIPGSVIIDPVFVEGHQEDEEYVEEHYEDEYKFIPYSNDSHNLVKTLSYIFWIITIGFPLLNYGLIGYSQHILKKNRTQ